MICRFSVVPAPTLSGTGSWCLVKRLVGPGKREHKETRGRVAQGCRRRIDWRLAKCSSRSSCRPKGPRSLESAPRFSTLPRSSRLRYQARTRRPTTMLVNLIKAPTDFRSLPGLLEQTTHLPAAVFPAAALSLIAKTTGLPCRVLVTGLSSARRNHVLARPGGRYSRRTRPLDPCMPTNLSQTAAHILALCMGESLDSATGLGGGTPTGRLTESAGHV